MSIINRGGITITAGETSAIDTDPGRARVLVRETWSGAWTPVPYLEPIRHVTRAAPGMSEARFLWRYGNVKREDQTAFAPVTPQELNGQYVKIEIVRATGITPVFYGIIDDDALNVHAATTAPSGDQELQAWGLEYLLDRYTIRRAKFNEGTPTFVERIPEFNRRHKVGYSLLGNRTHATGDGNVFEFGSYGDVWSNRQIIESLLVWNLPDSAPDFLLAGQDEVLDQLEHVHRFPCGTTLRAAINKLIDRRRGLGWMVRVRPGSGSTEGVQIWVFSTLDEAVAVGAVQLQPNAEAVSYTLDSERNLDEVVVTRHSSQKFDRVVMLGGYLKSIFSIGKPDSTLEDAFPAGLQTDYKTGASGASDYAGLASNELKAARNDEARTEDRFDRLGAFRIPLSWDGTTGDGAGGVAKQCALLTAKDDGSTLNTPVLMWLHGRELLNHLPGLEVGKDYTTDPPGAADLPATGADPEMRKPFALIKFENRWRYLDKLSEHAEANKTFPNASVRMLDGEAGLQVDIRPRHLLMKNHWSGAEPALYGNALFDEANVMDYDEMLATVALETDQRLRIIMRDEQSTGDRELRIELDELELVYLAPNTVVGVDVNGNLRKAPPNGTFVRDDRDRLRAAAALAWAWYRRPRASVRISATGYTPIVPVGALLKAVQNASDTREVGTVVTSETWEYGPTRRVTIETQWQAMEIADFGPELPNRRAVGSEIKSLRGEVQALRERVGGLPARVGVASVLAVAAAGLIAFGSQNYLNSAAPSAVVTNAGTAPGSGLLTRHAANDLNTWADTSKVLLRLSQAYTRRDAASILVLLTEGPSGQEYGLYLDFIANVNNADTVYLWQGLRVTPVLADFDPAAQSWSTQGSLTLGTPVTLTEIQDVECFLRPSGGNCKPNANYGKRLAIPFTSPADSDVYGFLIETNGAYASNAMGSLGTVSTWSAYAGIRAGGCWVQPA